MNGFGFEPGRNCWRVEDAGRAAVVVETADYFEALSDSLERARRHVFILGWDFDRRERLGRGDDARSLQDVLDELLDHRPELHVWLLTWDYNVVYAAEREWFQGLKLRLRTQDRLHVHFDDQHPPGGSQHQKVVVIDDLVAYCGGIDLSRWRWDTREHAADDSRRTDPDGKTYAPFHDAMMVVDGAAAGALGELARDRWRRCGTEKSLPTLVAGGGEDVDPWPVMVAPQFRDTAIAVARTFPRLRDHGDIREVEALFMDSIAAARDYIYVENQYFTSRAIADALATRLAEPDGPDVVMVLPRKTGGWLEQVSMDVLRQRRLEQLTGADIHDRLRVCYPHQPGLPDDECISVHAKLMIIDDHFLHLGSANTSDRSMGLDSECDLAIEARGEPGVPELLDRMLSEHLDVDTGVFRDRFERAGRLSAAIDDLRRGEGRSLRPLDAVRSGPPLDLTPEADLVDPPEPIDPTYLVGRAIPGEEKRVGHRRLWTFLAFIAALLALAVAWRWTPLGDWLTTDRLQSWLAVFDDPRVRFLAVFGVIVITSLLMLPLSVLVVASALLLGPWLGFACAMAGALVSGGVAFIIGELMGGKILERYSGSRVHRLSERLSQRGILAVAMLRLVPVAPYTVVNLVAGASHLRLGRFMVGSAIGLLPGVGGLSLFSDSLFQAVMDPSVESLGILAIVVAIIGAAAFGLNRVLRNP